MSTLAIITARSASKGIKDKNIKYLNGKPLMTYTIESALQSHYIDELMVSTDSETYADIARTYGAAVPFLRSEKNSTDMAGSLDVIFEVLNRYEKLGCFYDNIILLQPTSPLRTRNNIDSAFKLFYEKGADSVVSVCECEYSPLLCNSLPIDLNLFGFIKSENLVRRQEQEKYYRLNGAIYISKVSALRAFNSFYGRNSYAYIMSLQESIDIDSEFDFEYAEFLVKRRIKKIDK